MAHDLSAWLHPVYQHVKMLGGGGGGNSVIDWHAIKGKAEVLHGILLLYVC